MVPIESIKCFHDFTVENLNMQVLIWSSFAIFSYKKIATQQLQGGLCNEFDSSSFELQVFESEF